MFMTKAPNKNLTIITTLIENNTMASDISIFLYEKKTQLGLKNEVFTLLTNSSEICKFNGYENYQSV